MSHGASSGVIFSFRPHPPLAFSFLRVPFTAPVLNEDSTVQVLPALFAYGYADTQRNATFNQPEAPAPCAFLAIAMT